VAAKDRIQAIKQMVANDKKVAVSNLSSIFQVTEETIRRDLEKLEDEGFLTRTYGGAVLNTTALSDNIHFYKRAKSFFEEKQIIAEKLTKNVSELDRTIQHAATLLSELTNLTSFAITPSQESNHLRYVNFLPVDESTVVLMIVTESGRVTNTAIKMKTSYKEENLSLLSKVMTYNYKGKTLSDILTHDIIRNFETDIEAMSRLVETIRPNFISTLENMLNVDLFMDGVTNIFSIPEYNDIEKAKVFLEMINKKKHFTDVLVKRDNGVIITIGNENPEDVMRDCSLITATYHIDGKLVGKLGVIGPTRMKYDEVTSIIEYITDNISQTFKLTGGDENDE